MLLRAEYVVGKTLKHEDFVGETAERDFATWLQEIARDEERFRYLGRKVMPNPIRWLYDEQGELQVWNGLLAIGEPDLVISDSSDVHWFFENHLNVPMGEIHIGDNDVAERPTGWFNADYIDIVDIEPEEEESADTSVFDEYVNIIEEEEPMSKFEIWLRTFVDEKDMPLIEWNIRHKNKTYKIDNYDVVEIICDLPVDFQLKIKQSLVAIDLVNGDVNAFLKHLAEGYVKTHY